MEKKNGQEHFTLCGMCPNSCPVQVSVAENKVEWLFGNPHDGMEGALCPIGGASKSQLHDQERLKTPLIREGERGSGRWKEASWDEAFEFIAEKLKPILEENPQSFVLGNGTGSTDIAETFTKALGSPNYFNLDRMDQGSNDLVCRELFGHPFEKIAFDFLNTKQVVFYGSNFFESINLKPVNSLLTAMKRGAKLTVLDPRVSITATKSHKYLQINPGTDLAFNYGLIKYLLDKKLYNQDFVEKYTAGLEALTQTVAECSLEWTEKQTGINQKDIQQLAESMAKVSPSVIFYPGKTSLGYQDDVALKRSIYTLNCLMGAVNTEGSLFITPEMNQIDLPELKHLSSQNFPESAKAARVDEHDESKFLNKKWGLPAKLKTALAESKPYPIKAALFWQSNPLVDLPNYKENYQLFGKLDFIISVDNYLNETAGLADVILPESTYLERTDPVELEKGLFPRLKLRKQVVKPIHNTLSGAMIFKHLAEKLGAEKYFSYKDEEQLVSFQMTHFDYSLEDFETKGFIKLTSKNQRPIVDDSLFLTTSKKIEWGSFEPYKATKGNADGKLRLISGGINTHFKSQTQNVPVLNDLMPENKLWIHSKVASSLKLETNEMVEVASDAGCEKIKVFITDFIHPETVFMAENFGRKSPPLSRCFGKGAMSSALTSSKVESIADSFLKNETFVQIKKISAS